MWNWLRKQRKSDSSGALIDDLKRKGYQRPYANMCDCRLCLMFHGPQVALAPPWIEHGENSFQMRVIDNAPFSSATFLYEYGNAATAVLDKAVLDRDRLQESLCDPHVESCLLGYPSSPEEIPEGPQTIVSEREDLWSILLFNGYFDFTRSWSGEVRHRAKVNFHNHAMFITEVETNLQATRHSSWPDA